MNDSEIIKALTTSSDPNNLNCQPTTKLCKEALDLIKRQQAEITKMSGAISYLESAYTSVADEVKVKTVQEFAEKLKEHSCNLTEYDEGGWSNTVSAVKVEDIDRLVEEMRVR